MDAALSTRLSALAPLRPGLVARLLHVVLALAIGGLCYRLAPPDFLLLTRLLMGWDGFVLSVLLLSWITIFHTRAADMFHVVRALHPDKTWLLLLLTTFVGTTISIVAVVLLLHNLQAMAREERIENISVSVVAIGSTWCLMHTLFALHYAHTYFTLQKNAGADAGLLFVGAGPTSYWDFVYFSFVVGMTSQTADVSITSLRMRQLVLFHSLMAFAFNTTIVALAINVVAGLL
ncbi:DUF1345 domain-containing protein [Hymenobacter armeniacus]|uniref:DUF1345 domain-containing protein n=1 Tax=Hymenobacter armeniacus TaxID=2771358 RepID=A0ABR8K0V4_9BACT|nr:DUF1345 domain-containing protein [Hymenobacter armeniacus]MBD2723849.1 DUF1345 domain-containing protein [Hymenobacter armeniacus]